jgi:DNA invertase Pin-like site-specific DNA recombinase
LENTDPVVDMLISIMEEEREQDNEHYEEVCKKNRENGSKGGRPKKNRTVIPETE